MGLMLVVVVLLASRSKSCQKVEGSSKSLKNLKGLKSCKGHQFGGTFTEAPILRRRTRASIRALTVFQALFARPRSSLNATSTSFIDKAKLMKLLMLCHVVSQGSQKDLRAEYSNLFPAVTSNPSAPIFSCKTYVLPLLLYLMVGKMSRKSPRPVLRS